MSHSVVIDEAAGVSWGLVDERRKDGEIGTVDERAVLVEREQLITGANMAIIASHCFKLFH